MRLLIASLVWLAGFILVVYLIYWLGMFENYPPFVSLLAIFAALVVVSLAVVAVFNRTIPGWSAFRAQSESDKADPVETEYMVLCSLTFRDEHQDCPVYFIDCEGQGVLCLYGAYLDEHAAKNSFPLTHMVITRYPGEDAVMALECSGEETEQLSIRDPDYLKIYGLGLGLEDGRVFDQPSFAEILRTLSD